MIQLRRTFVALAVVCSCLSILADSSAATQGIPDLTSIPEGNANDDEATSQALTYILNRCAEQYACSAYRSTGTYIDAMKRTRELINATWVEVVHRDPDELKVVFTSDSINTLFVANGEQIIQAFPAEKSYLKMPQPASLDAFSEEERPGEIVDDHTNSIMRSLVTSLLISNNRIGWLRANVTDFIYEGTEEVTGATCWRIKFIQENPDMVVMNWIDTDSYFLRKVAVIQAVDADGEFVHSYESAHTALMRLMLWDSITTDSSQISDDDFELKVPDDWKVRQPQKPESVSRSDESVWTRMFRVAAAETGRTTTMSLSRDLGEDIVQLKKVYEGANRISGIAAVAPQGKDDAPLVASISDGSIVRLKATGDVVTSFSAAAPFRILEGAAGTTSPLLIAAEDFGTTLYGYDLSGELKWKYDRNSQIADLLVTTDDLSSGSRLYVAFSDSGLYTLRTDGQVTFASRRLHDVVAVAAGEIGERGRCVVAANTAGEVGYYSSSGKNLSQVTIEDPIGLMLIDESSSDSLIGISSPDGSYFNLRRYKPDGSVTWTVGLAEAEEAEPIELRKARLISQDSVSTGTTSAARDVFVTLLSDGRISFVSMDGQPVWRGRIKPEGDGAGYDPQEFASGLAVSDIDGDGDDEIYVACDAQLLELVPVVK